jgi:hypothetical protein
MRSGRQGGALEPADFAKGVLGLHHLGHKVCRRALDKTALAVSNGRIAGQHKVSYKVALSLLVGGEIRRVDPQPLCPIGRPPGRGHFRSSTQFPPPRKPESKSRLYCSGRSGEKRCLHLDDGCHLSDCGGFPLQGWVLHVSPQLGRFSDAPSRHRNSWSIGSKL